MGQCPHHVGKRTGYLCFFSYLLRAFRPRGVGSTSVEEEGYEKRLLECMEAGLGTSQRGD
jgi:hypothetical protein